MATTSEIKVGMAKIADRLSEGRAAMLKAKTTGANVSAALASIPADFSDIIATINAFGTTNPFEALAKAELAKMTVEFTALKADADALANLNLND